MTTEEPREHATETAEGTFEVEITPEEAREGPGSTLGRLALAKRYRGDLDATAEGTMLTATTPAEGSAGYVAVERVSGTLAGRSGSFTLQHSGLMEAGEQELAVRIVPGSGTDALAGIRGALDIRIEGGVHRYVLEYTLP